MFWIVFTILVLLFAYLGDEKVTKDRKLRGLFRALLVFTLSYTVALCSDSADRQGYLDLYKYDINLYRFTNIGEWLGLESRDTEIGFVILAKLCRSIGLSGDGMLFVVALITNALIVSVFYRFRYPVLSFFLFIMTLTFLQEANLVRQLLAASIGLYSTRYIVEGNWKKYLIFVFIAFTIHKSSLLLLLALPLLFVKDSHYKTFRYVMLGLWLSSFIFVVYRFPLLERFSMLFEATRYTAYGDDSVTLGISDVSFNLFYNAIVLFFFLFGKKPRHVVYLFYFVMGCFLQNSAFNMILLMRASLFFFPMYCAMSPEILADNKLTEGKQGKSLGTAMQGLLFLVYLRTLLVQYVGNEATYIGTHVGSIFDIF